ncbi:MAG: regulatory protein RecX [Clostridia bacterium]|nr:regulatory protein RecX [Clostridia bacterium]
MDILSVCKSESGNEVTLKTDSGYFNISKADYACFLKDSVGTADISEFEEHLPIFIPESAVNELEFFAEKLKAIKYAMYILGIGDKSEKQLREKLKLKSYSPRACDEAISVLKKNEYISDERYCARKCEILANTKLFGKYRIISELFAKGISRSLCERVLEECEIDFEENLNTLFEKLTDGEIPETREQKKKISDKLLRYGYSYDEVSELFFRYGDY